MDIGSLGLDLGVIAGVICLTKILTMMADPNRKFERYYPLLPLLFGGAIAVPMYWTEGVLVIIVKAVVYGAVAAYLYKTGKTTILGA